MQINIYFLVLVLLLTITSCVTDTDYIGVSDNSEPIFTLLKAEKSFLEPGETTRLISTATDTDTDDTLIYRWESEFGEIIEDTSNHNSDSTAFWIAPQETGEYIVVAVIADYISEIKDSIKIVVTENPNLPIEPSLIYPDSGKTNQPLSIEFSWHAEYPEEKNINFSFYFGENSNLQRIDTVLTLPEIYITGLENDVEYFWKVVSFYESDSGRSDSTESKIWSFKTRNIISGSITGLEFVNVTAGNIEVPYNLNDKLVDFDFQIMKYEVTNSQLVEFLNGLVQNDTTRFKDNILYGYFGGNESFDPGFYPFVKVDTNSGFEYSDNEFIVVQEKENYPASNLSWFAAFSMANYSGLSLPTLQQWIRAAQGDSFSIYPGTDTMYVALANYASVPDTIKTEADTTVVYFSKFGGTTPVGAFNGTSLGEINTEDSFTQFGAYDMAGNVWEWCKFDLQKSQPVLGGAYVSKIGALKSTSAHNYQPEIMFPYIGVRFVKNN